MKNEGKFLLGITIDVMVTLTAWAVHWPMGLM